MRHTPSAGMSSWLAALRLQFHPMTWLGYGAGAAAAATLVEFRPAPFWFGLGALFCVEVATILWNEYVDYPSDRRNRNASMFSGGSRVLVEQRLSFSAVRAGIIVALTTAGLLAIGVLATSSAGTQLPALVAMAAMVVLALGYSAPPLRLSYRGLGEIDVALTMGAGVLLCGFLFQGGDWRAPLPWLLGAAVSLAILPSIVLAGVPDLDADRAAGKRTVAVRVGVRLACALAALATVAAAMAAVALDRAWAPGVYAGSLPLVVLHAVLVLAVMVPVARQGVPRRIDLAMAMSLSYVLWFAAVPLLHLLR
jgi:1,4-dihydroxy-2-naphthoate polyprenyltransferase